jgi:hypothetical protein
MNTRKRKRKGGDGNAKAEGLEGPSEDSKGEEGQLGKESHLARRVLMVASTDGRRKPPLLLFKKQRGQIYLKKERRRKKWKSIQY